MGGILGGGGLFGNDQQQQSSSQAKTVYRPEEANLMQQQVGNIIGGTANQQNTLQGLQSRFMNNAPQFNYGYQTNAGLNTNFQGPQFSQGLDATGQALMSTELGNRQAALSTQQGQLAQQFRNNPALANILGSQAASQSQLANNPLAFAASQAQDERQINRANATNQAQQMGNEARLAGGQFANQGLGMQNALLGQNLGQVASLGQQGLQNQGSLYDVLSRLGQQFGTQVSGNQASSFTPGIVGQLSDATPLGMLAKGGAKAVGAKIPSMFQGSNGPYGQWS